MRTVYETSLGVEAHMVCDLLHQAGIAAHVEGEFLQGAAGELPLGNLVRVLVSDEHMDEARQVIADWERRQPRDTQKATPRKTRSLLAFVVGAALGSLIAWVELNTPVTRDGIDYDGDGKLDERYTYEGQKMSLLEYDRNADGKPDVRFEYDSHGMVWQGLNDDDFDGAFEMKTILVRGQSDSTRIDRNQHGRPEEIWHFRNGVAVQREMFDMDTGAPVKRQNFRAGRLASADIDTNRDGNWDRHMEYDAFEEAL